MPSLALADGMTLQQASFLRDSTMETFETGQRVTVVLPAKLWKRAQRLARRKDDRSLSSLLRVLLKDYIEANSQARISA